MNAREMLNRLARSFGVQTSYVDLSGRTRFASPEALRAVLRALGAPVSSARDVPGVVWRRHWRDILGAQLALAGAALRHAREPAARARLRGQLVGLLTAPRLLLERRRFSAKRRVSDEYIMGLLA